jgi:hypothetical protein
MSRDLKPQPVPIGDGIVEIPRPIPGSSVTAWLKAMTVLLATEGDRRRLSLELKRAESKPEGSDGVADLDEYRRRLSG